jgi:hypothetical protein
MPVVENAQHYVALFLLDKKHNSQRDGYSIVGQLLLCKPQVFLGYLENAPTPDIISSV